MITDDKVSKTIPQDGEMPFVSVVVPCRNEEDHIGPCLESILASDYPADKLEILVVDGESRDATASIGSQYAQRHANIKLLNNPKRIIPSALNIGIRAAVGDVVMQASAHATYDSRYIPDCINGLAEFDADLVGGVLRTQANGTTTVAKAIAMTYSHPFGAGNARFRIGSSTLRFADAVFAGCFKRDVFRNVGLFNEDMVRSSDIEMNTRLRKSGGRILLIPEASTDYYPSGTLPAFWQHNFHDGLWATYPLKFGAWVLSWRHLVPLAFVATLTVFGALAFFSTAMLWLFLAAAGAYVVASGLSTIQIVWRQRDPKLLAVLPITFAARHVAYGLGSIAGLAWALTSKRFWAGLLAGARSGQIRPGKK